MSGISGFIDHNQKITEDHLKKSSATLAHRGGNGSDLFFEKKDHYTLGLANEYLATTDLSKKAQLPLTSTCGDYCITLDGTIYNYLELRESLLKYGVTFSTLSDAEVIIECYKRWGYQSFERLDGSFAFVLLDRKSSVLLVARDIIGAKPLYFYKEKGFYAFASEIKALLAYPTVPKKVNQKAMVSFFKYAYFTEEETIYQNLHKFKKGTLTTIDIHSGNSYDSPLTRQQLVPKLIENNHSEPEILAKIEDLLTESILKRNVASVPVGVLLSGGFDSATVAAILQKNQTKRIKTFTVGFKNEKLDEAPQARKIAEQLKTNHQEFYLDQNDAYHIAKNLNRVFDEPIGDSSAIPLLFLAEKIKKEVKVLLSAEGGDELFGGYRTYAKAIKLNEMAKKELPSFLDNLIVKFIKKTQPKMKEVLEVEGLLNKYLAINACFTSEQLHRLLATTTIATKKNEGKAQNIKDLLIHDLHNYLPNNIFFKNDKCFANYGMDNRDAILKNELVAYLSSLDPKWFIKDDEQKYLLKKITYKYIPARLMDQPKKSFVFPLSKWLKTALRPLVEEHIAKDRLKVHGLLNVEEALKIKSTFYAHPSLYNAQKVWLLLQFQMWYHQWMD